MLSFIYTSFYISDFLNKLLTSRKQRTEAFKAGKSKAKINDFELSDDEDKQSRTKRVSFLKTQQSSSNSNGTTASESHKNVLTGSPIVGSSTYDSFTSQNNEHFRVSGAECTRENSSLSYQTSDDTLLDMPLPLPSDSRVADTPGPEQSSQTPHLPATDLNDTTAEGLFSPLRSDRNVLNLSITDYFTFTFPPVILKVVPQSHLNPNHGKGSSD